MALIVDKENSITIFQSCKSIFSVKLHIFGTPKELGGTLAETTWRKKTMQSKFVISFLRRKSNE
jgi:hypothetical protein